jgi:hypothetical protein
MEEGKKWKETEGGVEGNGDEEIGGLGKGEGEGGEKRRDGGRRQRSFLAWCSRARKKREHPPLRT